MALNFDYSKVKDNDRLFEYRTNEPEQTNFIIGSNWWQEDDGRWCRYQPWFDSLLMTAMILMPAPGWGITEKNVEKFIDRLMMYQAVNGPLLLVTDADGKETGRFVTPEQVQFLARLKDAGMLAFFEKLPTKTMPSPTGRNPRSDPELKRLPRK